MKVTTSLVIEYDDMMKVIEKAKALGVSNQDIMRRAIHKALSE